MRARRPLGFIVTHHQRVHADGWSGPSTQNCIGDGWKRLLPQEELAYALALPQRSLAHDGRRAPDGAPPGLLRTTPPRCRRADGLRSPATVLRKGDGPLRVDHAAIVTAPAQGTSWRVIRPNAKSGVLDCIDGVVRFGAIGRLGEAAVRGAGRGVIESAGEDCS